MKPTQVNEFWKQYAEEREKKRISTPYKINQKNVYIFYLCVYRKQNHRCVHFPLVHVKSLSFVPFDRFSLFHFVLHCSIVRKCEVFEKFCSGFVVGHGCFVMISHEFHVTKWIYPFVPNWRVFYIFFYSIFFSSVHKMNPKDQVHRSSNVKIDCEKEWDLKTVPRRMVCVKRVVETDNDDREKEVTLNWKRILGHFWYWKRQPVKPLSTNYFFWLDSVEILRGIHRKTKKLFVYK